MVVCVHLKIAAEGKQCMLSTVTGEFNEVNKCRCSGVLTDLAARCLLSFKLCCRFC